MSDHQYAEVVARNRPYRKTLGLDIDFREQDMMRLDPALTGFDLVFVSWGGICWVPDIHAWSALVAERLRPGGVLVISEHHPLWEVLTVTENGQLTVTGDYFTPERDGYPDPCKAPQVTREIGAPQVPHRSYVWNLGTLVGAVLAAGLRIRSLSEFPVPEMYPGSNAPTGIPATYLLTATLDPPPE